MVHLAPELDERLRLPPKYSVVRVLGRGGMGTVLEARHTQLGRRVAIKVLGDALRPHAELVTRFAREARAAGALSSPHAVKVLDVDVTSDGTPFMVMELLSGRDLAHVLEQDGPPAIGAAVRWVIEACDAIGEAHDLGIVHRDIKPSNLFICRETGTIKVLDFGIAKCVASDDAALTAGLAPLGTPQYMSPEQARCAKDVDARTDIWSLGVTLYELVCGRPPYDHAMAQACIVAVVTDPVPDPRTLRPDIPDELAAAMLRALAKDPDERFQSVGDLVVAIAPFAESPVRDADSLGAVATPRRTPARSLTTADGEPEVELRRSKPAQDRRGATRRVGASLAVAGVVAVLAGAAFVQRSAGASRPVVATSAAHAREDVRARPADPVSVAAGPDAAAPAPVRTSARPRAGGSTLVHGGLSGPGF